MNLVVIGIYCQKQEGYYPYKGREAHTGSCKGMWCFVHELTVLPLSTVLLVENHVNTSCGMLWNAFVMSPTL